MTILQTTKKASEVVYICPLCRRSKLHSLYSMQYHLGSGVHDPSEIVEDLKEELRTLRRASE